MKIKYATAHKWVKGVDADLLVSFGKNAANRLKSTLKKLMHWT